MTEKLGFKMDKKQAITILICLAIMVIFWVLPAPAPMTQIGMRVLGIFIGTVLLLSLVNTVWPVFLAVLLLSQSGVATLNEAIGGSFGSWTIYFIAMSFVMTHSLNESGFTSRLVAKFMSMKFVSKSPWVMTFSIGALAMLLGAFLDQVPATAFMLAFCDRVYRELGYSKDDSYPHIQNVIAVFCVNIGGAMTPISHPLTIIGLGVYEGITKQSISLFKYLSFGVPTGLVIFFLLVLLFRLFAKPDFSKFKDFDIRRVLDKQTKMGLREKSIVFIFFGTVIMWMLPGILAMFIPDAAIVKTLNGFGITFWALVAVVLLSVLEIGKRPLIGNIKEVIDTKVPWSLMLFISIGVYLGSAVSNPKTGVSDFISQNVLPLTAGMAPILIVLVLAFVTNFLTNFASNVTSITVMTGVGVTMALAGTTLNPAAVALVTTMAGCLAYTFPSGFAPIAMLHGNEWSNRGTIYKFGFAMMAITALVVTFIGYNIAVALA